VTSLDISRPCLKLAAEGVFEVAGPARARVRRCQANANRLPLAGNAFDLTWSAQSLYSLSPLPTLREMVRVTKPGGLVAVLENDSLHHLVLPWPPELELEVRRAEHQAYRQESSQPEDYYIGRRLGRMLREAGLADVTVTSWATTRQPPWSGDQRVFFNAYLLRLYHRIEEYLSPCARAALEEMIFPEREGYLLNDPHAAITILDLLAWGRKTCDSAKCAKQ
jgi:SAM-dependent methyltransferase